MVFERRGKICDSVSLGLPWAGKNVMTPLPMILPTGDVRVYLTICDMDNVGRVGFVDLDGRNPSTIKAVSTVPVLNTGMPGAFDEHGVLPTSLLNVDGRLYLYYSAYQRQISVPYTILSGLAVSDDGGLTFSRVSDCPILERCDTQMFQRSAIEVMKHGGKYLMWYTAGMGWQDNGGHIVPRYDIEYLESDDFRVWTAKPKVSLALRDDEFGLTMPQVRFSGSVFRMIYSIRSVSKGYRLGYAESKDGVSFIRMDEKLVFAPSESGWDSEMICFGKIITVGGRTYLFYCGNHYGIGGMGWAELVGEGCRP